MQKPTVFISHSSADREHVARLAGDLEQCWVRSWYSEWEILPGDSLRERIFQEGISGSTCMLVLITPHSIKSNWVTKELDAALIQELETQNAALIPCILPAGDASYQDLLRSMPLDVRARHVQDLTDYELGFRRLLAAVFRAQLRRTERDVRMAMSVEVETLRREKAELQLRTRDLEEQLEQERLSRRGPVLKLFLSDEHEVCGTLVVKKPEYLIYQAGNDVDLGSGLTSLLGPRRVDPRKVRRAVHGYNCGFYLPLVLRNEGDTTARNIVVELTIPAPVEVLSYPPELPSDSLLYTRPAFAPVSSAFHPVRLEDLDSTEDRTRARYKVDALVQTDQEELPRLYIVFPEDRGLTRQEATLTCTVISEQTKRVSGSLRVTLDLTHATETEVTYGDLKRIFDH